MAFSDDAPNDRRNSMLRRSSARFGASIAWEAASAPSVSTPKERSATAAAPPNRAPEKTCAEGGEDQQEELAQHVSLQ
ncbi:MAG: hypothetical protein AAFW46_09255, partial [Pseudomonadota bacterium]